MKLNSKKNILVKVSCNFKISGDDNSKVEFVSTLIFYTLKAVMRLKDAIVKLEQGSFASKLSETPKSFFYGN